MISKASILNLIKQEKHYSIPGKNEEDIFCKLLKLILIANALEGRVCRSRQNIHCSAIIPPKCQDLDMYICRKVCMEILNYGCPENP